MSDEIPPRTIVDSSGFAFQLGVERFVIAAESPFTVLTTEHAWTHPRTAASGFADIVLEDAKGIRLVVECKRARGGRWVFLRPDERGVLPRHRLASSAVEKSEQVIMHWTAVDSNRNAIGTDRVQFHPPSPYSAFCIPQGFSEGQKPMLERLAGELVLATEALAYEQYQLDAAHRSTSRDWVRGYVPVIVTTTPLTVCEFNPADVNIGNGLLPENATFTDVGVIRFVKNLSFEVTDATVHRTLDAVNIAKDRTVFVVNSNAFGDFLRSLEWVTGMPEGLRPFMDLK
jgi:hypothetical protein